MVKVTLYKTTESPCVPEVIEHVNRVELLMGRVLSIIKGNQNRNIPVALLYQYIVEDEDE